MYLVCLLMSWLVSVLLFRWMVPHMGVETASKWVIVLLGMLVVHATCYAGFYSVFKRDFLVSNLRMGVPGKSTDEFLLETLRLNILCAIAAIACIVLVFILMPPCSLGGLVRILCFAVDIPEYAQRQIIAGFVPAVLVSVFAAMSSHIIVSNAILRGRGRWWNMC